MQPVGFMTSLSTSTSMAPNHRLCSTHAPNDGAAVSGVGEGTISGHIVRWRAAVYGSARGRIACVENGQLKLGVKMIAE